MSKLEDKLSASIKPKKARTAPAAATAAKGPRPPRGAKPVPPLAVQAAAPQPAAAGEAARALHPRRVWPD